ncbi:retinoid-inducible serine carboxypeptidase-like protein [Lasius niger]|uniref:Retinoid-inducible serine carboxypeptidase-like protein n=1 Tax=Lasius niger TaxID=67767 RepID=A0A0J7KEZ4_LASNI|nr:retinoid-inducible serine carboxypeptidase-like protein [Lasius niger]
MVDIGGFDEIDTAAKETKAKVEAGEWKMAMKKCAFTQGVISILTYDVDFYNILTKRNYSNYGLSLQSLSYFNEVELLLDETNLKVFVYNGHLDLIVDISGTVNWVDNLRWKDADKWKNVTIREPLVVEDIVEGYYKIQDNFAMFWVNRAGHMVCTYESLSLYPFNFRIYCNIAASDPQD